MPRRKAGLQRKPPAAHEPEDQVSPTEHLVDDIVGMDRTALLVPVSRIEVSPDQPRKTFDEDSLTELAADIERHGLINPLTVYDEGGVYHLIAGERRLRALKKLGRSDANVRVVSRDEAKVIQLAENLQRENLPLLEEALALTALKNELDVPVRELATRVNKSKSYVDRRLQILRMPPDVQELLAQEPGLLTKAEQIAKIKDEKRRQARIAQLLAEEPAERAKPSPARGRPGAPVQRRDLKGGGFNLVVRYRPGKSDRDELIQALRRALQDLEEANNP